MSMISLLPGGDKSKDLQRLYNFYSAPNRKESLLNVYSSGSRLSLLAKRKRLTPLNMSQQSLSKAGGDRYVTQRVLSAKTHRVKQLQNQLADAHYHLQELSNENKVLRAVQKKQEIALSRYENSNAELPQVLNSHNEEMRIQQSKMKQMKAQLKETTQKLKERDVQLQQLRDEHQRLLELSKERNLPEREKLQHQVSELSAKVQQQNETITMLQRKLVLEAKNFKHQLQNEMIKHKDTRHDLDLAITNADKLSTIIEMKEKMLSTAASRTIKSPVKGLSAINSARPLSKAYRAVPETSRITDVNNDALTKLCENSRSLSSALSHDEDVSSAAEPRSRYYRSRTNSNSMKSTPNQTRKNSKESDDMIELAKTVQDGMAELAIYDNEFDINNASPDEVQKKIEVMKNDLMHKLKNGEDPATKKGVLRKRSTEESIDEHIVVSSGEEIERPKSRGRRSSAVSFYESVSTVDEASTTVSINNYKTGNDDDNKIKTEVSNLERKKSGKQIEKYCTEIIHDIEKSSKVIDKHMKEFNHSRLESDKIVQQLQAVDKINEFVNMNCEIPEDTLKELNNNFNMLTEKVLVEAPTRKRSISGRRSSRAEANSNLFGDASLSNQDLLEDLLGKK